MLCIWSTNLFHKLYGIIPTMESSTISEVKTLPVISEASKKALDAATKAKPLVMTKAQTQALDSGRNRKGVPDIAQHRARLGKEFMARMRADFQKHGIATIERVRKEKPSHYLELVARMVPMAMEVNVNHTFMDLLQEAQKRYQQEQYRNGNVFDAEVVVEE